MAKRIKSLLNSPILRYFATCRKIQIHAYMLERQDLVTVLRWMGGLVCGCVCVHAWCQVMIDGTEERNRMVWIKRELNDDLVLPTGHGP